VGERGQGLKGLGEGGVVIGKISCHLRSTSFIPSGGFSSLCLFTHKDDGVHISVVQRNVRLPFAIVCFFPPPDTCQ